MYTVLVCGSRTIEGNDLTWAVSAVADGLQVLDTDVRLVHGGARGGDEVAASFASSYPVFCVPADWSAFGPSAGPRRNERMLREYQPDVVLAFVDKALEASRGTHHMVSIARTAGVPVHVFDVKQRTQIL